MRYKFDRGPLGCLPASGGLSRRRFMTTSLAAGSLLTAGGALIAGRARADTPVRGGHFRIGINSASSTDSFDPATMNSRYHVLTNFTCRNMLVEIDENNVAIPELAESWEATPDAKEWRFRIRKGVQFHNGKPLEPADVVATLNYHRGENSQSVAKPLLADVAEIRHEGQDVIVVMNSGNADFPFTMSTWILGIMPSTADGGVDAASGVGTGPYVVEAHNPGISTTFTRNENYWKEGRAHFDRVTFIAINDVAARQNALLSGEVDAINDVEIKTSAMLARAPGIELDDVTSSEAITLPMFADTAPFDDNNVRMALKLAIDREALRNTIFSGHATIANDFPISPIMPYWTDLEQRQYDPEQARFFLKKSGMSSLKVSFSTSDAVFAGGVDLGVLFAEHARAAGIEIDVIKEPDDGYYSNVWLKKPFTLSNWLGRPTPDAIYSIAYAKGAPWNESRFDDPRFNELMVMARAELDQKRRAEQYAEMAMIYRDRGSAIIPIFPNQIYARRSNIQHGPKLTGNMTLDGGRAAERWWMVS